jgi:hypothetical protein
MKKIHLVLLLLAFVCFLAAKPMYEVNLGFDLPGTMTFGSDDGDDDVDVNMGISPSVEALWPVMDGKLLAGAGLEYQLGRGFDVEDSDGAFGFIPIYAVAKYPFKLNALGDLQPEGILHLGFDMLTGNDDFKGDSDLSGGLHWALGLGVVHPKGYTCQLLYRTENGGSEGSETWSDGEYTETYEWDNDISYRALYLSIGYQFK